jgi:uncharacterized membrane protein HdeD (DUF308 family)
VVSFRLPRPDQFSRAVDTTIRVGGPDLVTDLAGALGRAGVRAPAWVAPSTAGIASGSTRVSHWCHGNSARTTIGATMTDRSSAMRSLPASLLWRGALAIVVGVIAFAWPGITIGAFVILFGIYAFLAAVMEFGQAFGSERLGPVAGHIVLAVLDVGAGVIALAWPGITALVLVTVVAVWAFVIGVMEAGLAFRSGETAGERALLGLTGLVSISLGVALATRPDIGAITIAQVYGLFSLVSGISSIVVAANLRRSGQIAPVERLIA